jgi:hypothetical protein
MATLSMLTQEMEWTCLYIPTFGSYGLGEVPQDAEKQVLACTAAQNHYLFTAPLLIVPAFA